MIKENLSNEIRSSAMKCCEHGANYQEAEEGEAPVDGDVVVLAQSERPFHRYLLGREVGMDTKN